MLSTRGLGLGVDSPSGFTVLAGVFLTGVTLEVAAAVDFTGVGPVVVLFVLTVFAAGVLVTFFLMVVGLVAVDTGFEAVLTGVFAAATGVFLTGVVVATGFLVDVAGRVFCVPRGVLGLTGVAFAGTEALG
jgi:hypothetical protein